ncbi:MAG: thioredoxin domain-containing protein [Patescibacteria group bacterium]|jgi:protein-disulfide isomerase
MTEQNINFNGLQNNLAGPKKRWYKRWWGIVIIIFGGYVILTNAIYYYQAANNKPVGQVIDKNQVTDDKLYLHSEDDPAWGQKSTKVKIVEFADFACPYCYQSFPVVREIMERYQDKIYFVYRDFPITTLAGHENAALAAEAGNCAQEQNKFWPMHDKIFMNQAIMASDDLKRFAKELSLDTQKFNNCLDSHKYQQEVARDLLDGNDLGVRATPTFFINGYRIAGSIPREKFMELIEQGLAEGN